MKTQIRNMLLGTISFIILCSPFSSALSYNFLFLFTNECKNPIKFSAASTTDYQQEKSGFASVEHFYGCGSLNYRNDCVQRIYYVARNAQLSAAPYGVGDAKNETYVFSKKFDYFNDKDIVDPHDVPSNGNPLQGHVVFYFDYSGSITKKPSQCMAQFDIINHDINDHTPYLNKSFEHSNCDGLDGRPRIELDKRFDKQKTAYHGNEVALKMTCP